MASQQALPLYDTPRASIDGKRQSDARWPSTSHSPSMSRQPSSANLEHKRAGQAPTRHAATSWTAHRRATPLLVLGWIGLSSAVILNSRSWRRRWGVAVELTPVARVDRHILIDRSFDYPITLTTIHLVFQTVGAF